MKIDIGLLILRLSFGGTMLLAHGWGKMMKYEMLKDGFPDPLGIGNQFSLTLAIFAEVLCAFFIVIGLKTRWAAFPLVITMLVAVFIIHSDDPWKVKELAVMYGFAFFTLIFLGSGRFSIDQLLKKG